MKAFINLAVILFIISLADAGAQSKKSFKAYDTYATGEYFKAIDQFKEAYQKTTDKKEKLDIAFYIAESYRKTNNSLQAELWYRKVLDKNYENPLAILYYADALKMNQKYEEAKIQYKAYKELVPGDPRGNDGIVSCDLALEWMEYPTGYEVEEMKFFNSKFNDFSPSFGSEDYRTVYFTSSRDEGIGKSEHGGTGQNFSDIFVSVEDRKGKWSTPVPLEEPLNTEAEEGTTALSSDYNTLYFTRCGINKRKAMGCEIYEARRDNDKWEKIEPLGLAADSIVIAHPAISPDGNTLYFVSDMEGSIQNLEGENSKDLWMVTRTGSDKWSEPENLGPVINTPEDELFPFVHSDGTLYFSSNGHIGMGGLDIYKAKKNENGNWEVENMKYPVNSSSDDFGITFEKDLESGFLSSTRKGRGNDDIYSFLLPPLTFSVIGTVKNEKTDEIIPEAIVKSISSDGITIETQTGKDGTFKFNLTQGTDYVFIASKEGKFLKGKERETTKGLNQSTELKTEIYLTPIDQPIEVENIFFDFNKWDLRPESMVSLDKLVETLNENDNITIELGSHTDSRASDDYNMELSRKRAQSVVDYLIQKGIARDRLIAKGYGESEPKTVDNKDNEQYPFLAEGQKLTEKYIESLPDEDQKEMAHFLNRRTEFKVLRTDYSKK